MNEPKLAGASVDTERVIRDLLDAFKSLKTATTPPTCAPSTETELSGVPASHDDPSNKLALVGDGPPEVSLDSPTQPDAPSYSTEIPGIDIPEPEQVSGFERIDNGTPANDQIEGQSSQYGIIEAYCKDHGTVERLHVTREELQALADTSLLGTLTCKQDVLFILRQTRAAKSRQVSARPEPLRGSSKDVELSEFRWWAEHVRRESMARDEESNSSNDIEPRNPLDRPFVLSLAVVLMTTAIAIGIEMC